MSEKKLLEHGRKCIVRCDRSGVYYGEVVEINKGCLKVKNVRNLYYWNGAARIEQLSRDGVANPKKCKFTVYVDEMILTDVIQIIPCTDIAIKSIEGVDEWTF